MSLSGLKRVSRLHALADPKTAIWKAIEMGSRVMSPSREDADHALFPNAAYPLGKTRSPSFRRWLLGASDLAVSSTIQGRG